MKEQQGSHSLLQPICRLCVSLGKLISDELAQHKAAPPVALQQWKKL